MRHEHANSRTVTLLCGDTLTASDRNAIKLVEFLGGTVELARLSFETSRNADAFRDLVPPCARLMSSAETLVSLNDHGPGGEQLRSHLCSAARHVFVHGFGPGSHHARVLKALTSGALHGVEVCGPATHNLEVATECQHLSRQLSGLSFAAWSAQQFCFIGGSAKPLCQPVISWGGKPVYARWSEGGRELLLLASNEIADLDAAVLPDASVLSSFSSLAPLLMFLHGSSGGEFWHNDAPLACFVVDDPLLKKRYGFLDFHELLQVMERSRFCTSLGFIPWNHNRSTPSIARLFGANPHRYSIAVHGCDHTWGEFGGNDVEGLRAKAGQALRRMAKFQQDSRLEFDPVMIFPQGIFSTSAMKALRLSPYLAAVNTTPYPVDPIEPLTLREMLDVAVMRFSGFPLFVRRPATNLAELAFDLFMGKPALIVEHHDFFRQGYGALMELVQKLYQAEARLQWVNLGTLCRLAHVKRIDEKGTTHVRCFTDSFRLRNVTQTPQRYLVRASGSHAELGHGTIRNCHTGDLKPLAKPTEELRLEPGEELRLTRGRDLPPVSASSNGSLAHHAGVFLRRHLSEFRADYLYRSFVVSRSARRLFGRKPFQAPASSVPSDTTAAEFADLESA